MLNVKAKSSRRVRALRKRSNKEENRCEFTWSRQGSEVTAEGGVGWWMGGRVVVALTRDGVLVTVTLTDANQEGAIFVLGSEQQLLSFHAVYVAVVPPARRKDETDGRDRK